jgi:hypothetical protein
MMRSSVAFALSGFLALGAAGSAGAATLDYFGTLSVQLTTLPGMTAAVSGTVVVNASLGGPQLSSMVVGAGLLGPVTVSIPVTSNLTINSVVFTAVSNRTGSFYFGPTGGPPAGGPMGLSGMAKICLYFAPCAYSSVTIPLSPVGGVGVGVGGTQPLPGPVSLTIRHNPWTIGQPVITLHTANSSVTTPALPGGFAHGPASLTTNTAQHAGVVQLVTVSKVFTDLTYVIPETTMFAVIRFEFAPEPGTLLLLGLGTVGFGIYGRRRRSGP